MRFLYDNLPAIYVAVVAAVLGWLFGGTRGDLLVPVIPWLLLFTTEVLFVFPQKHAGETTYEARERVWSRMKRDPLVWISLGLVLLLAVPFVNVGLCPGCDAGKIALGADPAPPVPFIPFCANVTHHLNVFLWFATALSTMLVVRHCLADHGKRLALSLIVWNGVGLAVLGFVQIAAEAPGPLWAKPLGASPRGDFFSTWGYPNMAGDYFTALFALALALWRRNEEDVRAGEKGDRKDAVKASQFLFWRKHLYLIPAALFFFAALNTLSRAAILLVTSLAVVFFAHAFLSFTARLSRARRLKAGALCAVAVIVTVFGAYVFMPGDVQREVGTLDTTAVLDRVTGRGQYHVRVATELWKDHLLFGCGGWGYKHFSVPKMTPEELDHLQRVGGVNVHNDYLQFLAEHGLVGFGAMVAIVLMLLFPVAKAWRKLVAAARFAKTKALPKPIEIFALPAPVFCILGAAVATLVHSFGDCALRSPAVLTLFLVELAVLPGFLPKLGD